MLKWAAFRKGPMVPSVQPSSSLVIERATSFITNFCSLAIFFYEQGAEVYEEEEEEVVHLILGKIGAKIEGIHMQLNQENLCISIRSDEPDRCCIEKFGNAIEITMPKARVTIPMDLLTIKNISKAKRCASFERE